MDPKRQQQLYEEAMGTPALNRQLKLAKEVCRHCNVRSGHHPLCPRREKK